MKNHFKLIRILYFSFLLLTVLWQSGFAHGYVFSKANEEMREEINLQISRNIILMKYESTYFGQIAPHIRNMIDTDADTILTEVEIDSFFQFYKDTFNKQFENTGFEIGSQPVHLHLATVLSPRLQSDSLLAPFNVQLIFTLTGFDLTAGEYDLYIDPKVLFEGGNHFVHLAKELVAFTRDQEQAIGRFLQLGMTGDLDVQFISTYPGRLKKHGKMVSIYGVFYDNTLLKLGPSNYQKIHVRFKIS